MQRIDLHSYYPWYPIGSHLNVPDEIVDVMDMYTRRMRAYKRNIYRNKANYSLDLSDGIELLAIIRPLKPDEIIERNETIKQLYAAIACLPDKQAKRIYAHFFLNMSMSAIARAEGVSKSQVSRAINKALNNLKRIFEDF